MTTETESLLARLEALARRIEARLPPLPPAPDWSALAHRWQGGALHPIHHPHAVDLDQLLGIDRQRTELERNTRQFLAGLPANNALLWGARGTGKSSLIKALLNRYAEHGLRVIEVDRADLAHLSRIVEPLRGRSERFLLFADDLSFEADDPSYKALKATIEGSLAAAPENVLIYATSNRRHLLPEYQKDNEDSRVHGGEIHHGEAVEEKISLSERFGLWLSFHPFSQEQYLAIVASELARDSLELDQKARAAALRWALARGSRSGRVAWQFARDWCGRQRLAR